MRVSVIIPYRPRPAEGDSLLRWTLEGYLRQQLPPHCSLQLLVGADGASLSPPSLEPPPDPQTALLWRDFPHIGAAAVRNRLAALADGELLLFGNADARPDPDLVRWHLSAIADAPPQTLILGSAPWEKPPHPTTFDALLAETPAVFFYHQLRPGHSYDFRHAWTLNLSLRRSEFLAAGGFAEQLRPVYYEDLDLGYRLLGPTRKGVLYEPRARVLHRHPTTLEQYLDREELLGLMAPVLARVSPAAFAAIYGNADPASLARHYQTWVAMDHSMHRWAYQRLRDWATKPEYSLGPPASPAREQLLMTIYQMHVPLKRLAFRLGFLRGLDLVDDAHWQLRQPAGLWRKIVEP